MLKEQAVPRQANKNDPGHSYCERVREVHATIHTSALYKFTFSWIDTLWKELNEIVYELDRLPALEFKELIEVLQEISEARDELRLARFLFDVEEIDPVRRLVMRNRAVLRSALLLQKALGVWPSSRDGLRPRDAAGRQSI